MAPRPNPTLERTPLREWRERTGRTYAELAEQIGVNRRTVMWIAAGRPPTPHVAVKVAKATGIPVEALCARPYRGRFASANERAVAAILERVGKPEGGR